jgi:hypothetical protein
MFFNTMKLKWRIRLVFYGAMTAAMTAIVIFIVIGVRSRYRQPATSAELLVASDDSSDTNPVSKESVKQSSFLENQIQAPGSSVAVLSEAMPAPSDDLLLIGLNGLGSKYSAFFMIKRPGEPDYRFSLREGEQNDWLDVISIDPANGMVKAILKRPVVRIRKVGTEVILSFKIHGAEASLQ